MARVPYNAGKGGTGDIRDTDKLVKALNDPNIDSFKIDDTEVTATASEINQHCDESANVETVTTTNVITAAESGKTFILNSATAFVSTLPPKAAGLRYKFYGGATGVTGGNHTIVCTNDDNTIHGQCMVAGALVAAADEGSINLVADKWLNGDYIEVFNDGVAWHVSGMVVTSGGCTFTT
mgnify:FL=1